MPRALPAAGTPGKGSDVDLLVVMEFDGPAWQTAARIRLAVTAPFPLDLLLIRPAELRQRLSEHQPFWQEIHAEGVVLLDSERI